MRGDVVPITFAPMRAYMKTHQISYYYLANQGIDAKTLDRIRHDLPITTSTLGKLCDIMHCTPAELIDYQESL